MVFGCEYSNDHARKLNIFVKVKKFLKNYKNVQIEPLYEVKLIKAEQP